MLRAGEALHAVGMPAHRLEAALGELAATLDLRAQFFSTPTALFASFADQSAGRTCLLRVEPGDAALEKLTRLERILERVRQGKLEPHGAARAVAAIAAAPLRFGQRALALSNAAIAAPSALLLGGGWRELSLAAMIGLAVGALSGLGASRPALARVLYPMAGAAAALIAGWAAAHSQPLVPGIATLAGLIALVPGLTLTRAVAELAARHLVSGAARLAGALLVFLTLGFGVALGTTVATALFGPAAASAPVALAPWLIWPGLLLAVLALVVQFQAHPQQAGWILIAGVVAVFGLRLGGAALGPELGAFAGALAVGLAGNAAARWRRLPASLLQMPGLILLVPGSIGFESVRALVAHDTLSGIQAAFSVGMVSISLVTGLLVANVLLPSRRPV